MQIRGPGPRASRTNAPSVRELVSEPELLRLFDYWCAKRAGRAMPARADIDPIEIPWALSRLFLVDYTPEGGFRYRVAGGELSDVFGRGNLKGMTLRDFLPLERAQYVENRWLPLVEKRSVVYMSGQIYLAAERAPIGERLMLPLADSADGPVTGLVGMTVCQWVAGKVPKQALAAPIHYIPVETIN